MSESGHSQPGMYGQGRRRRRRRGEREAGPPGQNLSGPSRDREYQPRERRVILYRHIRGGGWAGVWTIILKKIIIFFQDGSEDPPGPLIQKTPIILAKPPGERVCYLDLLCTFNNLNSVWRVFYASRRHVVKTSY